MNKRPVSSPAPDRLPAARRVAALAVEIELDGQAGVGLSVPTRLRVVPDGAFSGVDGRPAGMEGVTASQWVMNAQAAQAVMARFTANGLKLVIDYDHQTLHAVKNGQPAPAAGWITALSYEPGRGLMASVTWTQEAHERLADRQYLYLSPVLLFDAHSGEVQGLHSVALTNTPALNALGEIAAMAALAAEDEFQRRLPGTGGSGAPASPLGRTSNEDNTMDKAKVLVALGLSPDTSDDTALTALSAVTQKASALQTEMAALKANQFDAGKHIPLEEHKKVCDQLAALQAEQDKAAHAQLMTAALSDGRILPPNEAYWRQQPLAALSEFLKGAQPLAALSGTQTGGKPPAGTQMAALSAEEQAACAALGLSAEAFAKARG